MTDDEIRAAVLGMLHRIAPEADLATLDHAASFREQLDVDSMDLLNLVIAIEKELGVEIPETDYGKVGTVDALVRYLARVVDSE